MPKQNTTYQFPGFYEPNVRKLVGTVFQPTGSATPTVRRFKGLAMTSPVTRESAGTLKFKFADSYPSGSFLGMSYVPWFSGSSGPLTIGAQVKHVNETHPTGAEVYVQVLSGTVASGSTVMGRAVADPSIHLTGSFEFTFTTSLR